MLLPKSAVDYGPGHPTGDHCAVCAHFRPPDACEVVAGDISPEAWCDRFEERRMAKDDDCEPVDRYDAVLGACDALAQRFDKHMGFEKLVASLAHRKDAELTAEEEKCLADAGVRDPAALAAWIGRKKLGKEAFQKKAAAGRRAADDEWSPEARKAAAESRQKNIERLEREERRRGGFPKNPQEAQREYNKNNPGEARTRMRRALGLK